MKEQLRRMETAEMRFVRAVGGYGMAGHERNEVIREELGITCHAVMEMARTLEKNVYAYTEPAVSI
jgi:hypothetical protein